MLSWNDTSDSLWISLVRSQKKKKRQHFGVNNFTLYLSIFQIKALLISCRVNTHSERTADGNRCWGFTWQLNADRSYARVPRARAQMLVAYLHPSPNQPCYSLIWAVKWKQGVVPVIRLYMIFFLLKPFLTKFSLSQKEIKLSCRLKNKNLHLRIKRNTSINVQLVLLNRALVWFSQWCARCVPV